MITVVLGGGIEKVCVRLEATGNEIQDYVTLLLDRTCLLR